MRFTSTLLIALLLATLPSFAAISFVGQCSASTTACTPPAHAVGDLFIAMAGANATSTIPTLPAGWTSVTTQALNGASTADSSQLIACKVATTSAETATGFTTANRLVVLIYRGQLEGLTAACANTILGTPVKFASTVNTTTTTETFSAVTNVAATSWDVGLAYASAATAGMGTAPAAMTNRISVGSAPAGGGHDTNGPVASFSAANVTLTGAGRILTTVVEIKASGCNLSSSDGIAAVQCQLSTAGGTPNTVAFTSNNTAANTILVVVRVSGGNSNLPTDTRNTYNIALQNIAWGAGSTLSIYYAYNIGAGANTVSETFSAGTARMAIFEISGLITTDPLDKTASASLTSTTPASGATTTTSQAVELAFGAQANANTAINQGAGAGWTIEQTAGNESFETEMQILTATGTPNATWHAITSGAWGSGIATFKVPVAVTCQHTLALLGAGCS